MKIELKTIVDQLSDVMKLPEGYKVTALMEDDGTLTGWTVTRVSRNGEIEPVLSNAHETIKEMIDDWTPIMKEVTQDRLITSLNSAINLMVYDRETTEDLISLVDRLTGTVLEVPAAY